MSAIMYYMLGGVFLIAIGRKLYGCTTAYGCADCIRLKSVPSDMFNSIFDNAAYVIKLLSFTAN